MMKDAVVVYIKTESLYINEFIDTLLDNGYGVVLHKVTDEDTDYMKIEILSKE